MARGRGHRPAGVLLLLGALAPAMSLMLSLVLVLGGGDGLDLRPAGAQVPPLPATTAPPNTLAPVPAPVPLAPTTTAAPAPDPPAGEWSGPGHDDAAAVDPVGAPPTTATTATATTAVTASTAATIAPGQPRGTPGTPADPGFSGTLPYPPAAAERPRGLDLASEDGGAGRRSLLAVAGGLLALAVVVHLRWLSAEAERSR